MAKIISYFSWFFLYLVEKNFDIFFFRGGGGNQIINIPFLLSDVVRISICSCY